MVSPRTRNLPRPSIGVVAVELQVDEPAQDAAHVVVDADAEVDQLAPVLLGVAHAVDAADRGDDDDVAAGQQRGRGRVAQAVDLVVDRRVLLDVRVARRDVRLGLVVVVVADEVLDPVVGEELAHLLGQLGGEALVGGEDQRRPLRLLDRPGDGRRLARAGDAEQRLEPVAARDALAEPGDRPSAGRPPARSRRRPGTAAPAPRQSTAEQLFCQRDVRLQWSTSLCRDERCAVHDHSSLIALRPPSSWAARSDRSARTDRCELRCAWRRRCPHRRRRHDPPVTPPASPLASKDPRARPPTRP